MNGRRRWLTAALALAATRTPAQPRAPRIYMILYRGATDVERGFRDYFSTNRIDVEFIERDVAQDIGKLPALIAEARALHADLIYTWGTPVTLAVVGRYDAPELQRYVRDIPVVFTMVASPEGAALVRTRSSSGRNLTGTSHLVPLAQQLSAIRAYRDFRRIGVLYNPAEPNSVQNVAELRAAARRDSFTLIERALPLDASGAARATALPHALAELAHEGVQLLYLGPDSFIAAQRKLVTQTALALRLPTFAATEIALRDGQALFGLVCGYRQVGALTAHKAALILRQGVAPAAIPIETLARFSYLVNLPVARALDCYPPLKVINYAEVIR